MLHLLHLHTIYHLALINLFHKLLYQTNAQEVFASIENVLRLIPDLNVDDFESIVSLVRINNSDQTLQNYAALSSEEKKIVYNQLNEILAELKKFSSRALEIFESELNSL